MRQETLYLDTSVVSNYFDKRDPLIYRYTREFWAKLPKYRVLISEVVRQEIQMAGPPVASQMMDLIRPFVLAPIPPEAVALSKEYIRAGIFSDKQFNDALHAAIATSAEVDYLVSWNFRHLVRVKTKRLLPIVNLSIGYAKLIQIIAPSEI
jgi:predicted nucleic acid-binding protein